MTRPKALVYAEDTLGVHEVYEKAQAARKELDDTFTNLSRFRDEKRKIEAAIADREMELLIVERGKHSDMAVAAMDRHLKVHYHTDSTLTDLRRLHRELTDDVEGAEYDVRIAEHDLRILTARMNELGGYLAYLAAVKNNATQPASTSEAETSA